MVENVCIRGESRLGYWIIIKKAPQSSVSVIGWHIWRHRVEPEAVFGAQLAASFCVNRWAEGISDHSWWSTERWPNEFTLRMQKGMRSIVIRFLMCFTLRAFVYMAQVWLQASQDESSRRKEDVVFPLTFWSHTFDGDVSRLPASVQRRQRLKSEWSVSSHVFHIAPWNCFDSSSHLLFICFHRSRELMGDLRTRRDTQRVIPAPLRVAQQVRRPPLTSASHAPDKRNESRP